MKKCKPFKCERFKKLYEMTWDKFPSDEIVSTCRYRVGNGLDCIKEEDE